MLRFFHVYIIFYQCFTGYPPPERSAATLKGENPNENLIFSAITSNQILTDKFLPYCHWINVFVFVITKIIY